MKDEGGRMNYRAAASTPPLGVNAAPEQMFRWTEQNSYGSVKGMCGPLFNGQEDYDEIAKQALY
jgi:hypothetical protein